ncbi:MAG: adenylate/guanylate cyclase domain-containing protein [Burkholderiales bacterium]|nr:adenylate/guanylate cyclase domain-containing protein [Burkholderiales bacterium]
MRFWHRHPWALRALALALAAVAATLPGLLWPRAVASLEDRAADMYWRLAASGQAEGRIVIVDIDERSLREIGPWPWPRETLAQLVGRIADARPGVQVVDIVLAEPREGDDALRLAVERARPVLAQLFSLDPVVAPAVGAVVGGQVPCDATTLQSFGHYGLAPALAELQPPTGHIAPRVDADGVIRHLPARVCHAGSAHETLGLAALLQLAAGHDGIGGARAVGHVAAGWELAARAGDGRWWGPPVSLRASGLPGVEVPLDARGMMRVPYRLAREALVSVSAADVLLRPEAVRPALAGTIVLVGSTAFGMADTVATPLGAVASGLEVHAQALVALLDDAVPYTPAAWPRIQAMLLIVVAALLWFAGSAGLGAPAKRLPLLGIGLATVALGGAVVALHLGSLWLPWLTVVAFSILGAMSLATAEHALARAQRERLSAHLGAYLPAPVAERLMASEPSGEPQFEPREVSILTAAVRNFPALAAEAPAQELAALLHAYACLAVHVVERHGGVVEHVVGDTLTAVWNAAGDCSDHARRAADAARDLVRATGELFASRRPVSESAHVQPLALGIGLESGAVVVGSYGPARRRAHATLGEAVSLALRLQQLTADLSLPILVGPHLAAQLPASALVQVGDYLLEGVGRDVRVSGLAGWADLLATDSAWAASATATGDTSIPGALGHRAARSGSSAGIGIMPAAATPGGRWRA